MQVYKYMDIGTAKPSKEMRRLLPHHLIDILEPSRQFSVGDFVRNCDSLIPEIAGRGKIPVISGGTAFYLKTFLYGLPSTPLGDSKIRNEVFRDLSRKGIEFLYNELCGFDPKAAEKIQKNDTYRISRAVEVIRQTGKAFSSFAPPKNPREKYRCCFIGLNREREVLYSRINKRVVDMFKQGLPDEVGTLKRMGFTAEDPGMKGIGYREFFEAEKTGCPGMQDILEKIQQNTRRYAKRQITFFKSIDYVRWFSPDDNKKIKSYISRFYEDQ